MSRRIPFVLLCCLAVAGTLSVNRSLAADAAPNLVGTYQCTGTNPGGGEYRGTTVINRNGDAYSLGWTIGPEKYDGTGLLVGNVLTVIWRTGNLTGVVGYEVESKEGKVTLKGRWTTHPSQGQVWTETLTR
jgi:hypothetical protein